MSTHIVDRIEAIRLTPAETGRTREFYIVVELGGDNNVRNARTNRRARDWSVTAIGEEWSVIGRACELASGCAGGMVKLRGRVTKPESYIRAYRQALANATDRKEASASRRLSITARIRFTAAQQTGYYYRNLLKFRTPTDETSFGDPIKVFHFDLDKPEDMRLWLEHCQGPAWNNADVFGPGTV
jgi:hypothetical protein